MLGGLSILSITERVTVLNMLTLVAPLFLSGGSTFSRQPCNRFIMSSPSGVLHEKWSTEYCKFLLYYSTREKGRRRRRNGKIWYFVGWLLMTPPVLNISMRSFEQDRFRDPLSIFTQSPRVERERRFRIAKYGDDLIKFQPLSSIHSVGIRWEDQLTL